MKLVAWFFVLCLLRSVSTKEPEFDYMYYEYHINTCSYLYPDVQFVDVSTGDLTKWRCRSHTMEYHVNKNISRAGFTRTMVLNDYMENCLRKVRKLNVTTYIPEKNLYISDVLKIVRSYPFFNGDQFVSMLKVFDMYEETYNSYHNNYKSLTTNITSLLPECFISQVTRFLAEVKENVDTEYGQLWFAYIYETYFEKPLIIILFFTGILMDGLLIFLFIKFKEMRTEPNLIILNIAICDLLTLGHLLISFYYTRQKLGHWPYYARRVFEALSPISTGASILALSVQRYRALQNHMNKSESVEISTPCRILLYLLAVWGVPALKLFLAFRVEIFNLPRQIDPTNVPSNRLILHYTVFALDVIFATAVPIVVTVLNTISSRRLRRFAKNIPGEGNHSALERSRSKSSTIIIYLAVIFCVTHMPLFAYHAAYRVMGTPPMACNCVETLLWVVIERFFYKLFYLNATLNSLALFVISKKYRQLLSSSFQCCMIWKRDALKKTQK